MYYARSENQLGIKQTVAAHSLRVAELCERFGTAFGLPYPCRLMGLLHDAGKYSELFQGVLEGTIHGVNHEAAGAYIVGNVYKKAAMPLLRCIYGHHKGLLHDAYDNVRRSESDAWDGQRQFSVSKPEGYHTLFSEFTRELALPTQKVVLPQHDDAIADMLLHRMLLSVLADADYISSAEHFDSSITALVEEQHEHDALQARALYDRLLRHIDEVRAKSKAQSDVNAIRERVLRSCIDAGTRPPGLFTLTAPTGTGKTLALLAFALRHAMQHNLRRVIVVLPYLSIIEQNADVYRTICGDVLEAHSQRDLDETDRLHAARFDEPVIVTTSVNFFESLFSDKPSQCRKLHHIAGSVVVFDEAQSLPPHLLSATLSAVNALVHHYGCTVLFSTATQPPFELLPRVTWRPHEIIPEPQSIFTALRRVNIEWAVDIPTPLSDIAAQVARSDSVCVILNLRRHTRALYDLVAASCESGTVFHISTDMCAAHRKRTLDVIRKRLEHQLPCRIISTQCIEAGVDLDVHEMYRALAPLDAIIQSAGRCNRNGNDMGRMVVFVPEDAGYPGTYYRNAAVAVKTLLYRHDIDVCDVAHMREYYETMFKGYDADDPKLSEAIDNYDYPEVDNRYNMIDNRGVQIIVPYEGCSALYHQVIETVKAEGGMTAKAMRMCAPITVSSFNIKAVRGTCEPVPYKRFGKPQREDDHHIDWYILRNDTLYDGATGALFDSGAVGDIVDEYCVI